MEVSRSIFSCGVIDCELYTLQCSPHFVFSLHVIESRNYYELKSDEVTSNSRLFCSESVLFCLPEGPVSFPSNVNLAIINYKSISVEDIFGRSKSSEPTCTKSIQYRETENLIWLSSEFADKEMIGSVHES